jgi:hypothetical protein
MVDFNQIRDVAGSLLPHGTTKDLINSGGRSLLRPVSEITKIMAEINRASGITAANQFEIMINLPKGHQIFSELGESLHGVAENGIAIYQLDRTSSSRQVVMSCESTSIPGRSLGSTPNKVYGPPMKYPYNIIYPDLDMTFRVHNNMTERKFFEAWQECAVSYTTNDANYYDEYVADIVIRQYGPPEAEVGIIQSLLEGNMPTVSSILSQGAGVAKSFGKGGQKAARLIGIADAAFNVFNSGNMPKGKMIAEYKILDAYPKNLAGLTLDHSTIGYHKQIVTFEYKKWETNLSTHFGNNASFTNNNILDNAVDQGIRSAKSGIKSAVSAIGKHF